MVSKGWNLGTYALADGNGPSRWDREPLALRAPNHHSELCECFAQQLVVSEGGHRPRPTAVRAEWIEKQKVIRPHQRRMQHLTAYPGQPAR
jgi:hypothetical protein